MNTSNEYYRTDYLKEFLDKQDISVSVKKLKHPNKAVDAIYKINGQILLVVYKRQIQPQNILNVIEQLKGYANDEALMVVAEYITPNAKTILKEKGINYLDGAGNIYLKLNDVLLFIDSKKSIPPNEQNKYQQRAFTKTGAAVVFQFLMDHELVNAPQRTIAEYANVSLGTVPKVFNQLEDEGYIIKINEKQRQLSNTKKLLDKWVEVLNDKVLPGYFMQKARFTKGDELDFFKQTKLMEDTLWGGEAAAAKITEYLIPEDITLFTELKPSTLAKSYKLVPDKNGSIKVYHKFWNHGETRLQSIHPLLVYAQLVGSGDSRNLETAALIYKHHIEPEL